MKQTTKQTWNKQQNKHGTNNTHDGKAVNRTDTKVKQSAEQTRR